MLPDDEICMEEDDEGAGVCGSLDKYKHIPGGRGEDPLTTAETPHHE